MMDIAKIPVGHWYYWGEVGHEIYVKEANGGGRGIARAASEESANKLIAAHNKFIPDGWKLVPVVPTKEMCGAGLTVCLSVQYDNPVDPEEVWKAMMGASPEVSQE